MENQTVESIFVQIASYRDPELLPTIRDCIGKAKYPENLVFSISWQHSTHDKWDNLEEFKDDRRFKIIDILHTESKGTCWARNQLQQLYNGEQYTLQLDSHHRFVKNWDEELISMFKFLQSKGYAKPLLTTYAPMYKKTGNQLDEQRSDPLSMEFYKFTPDGVVLFTSSVFQGSETYKEPVKAKFYSAHFCFTLGEFCREVQHDPAYYFHGEEISIAVRAFTHGYDLFHPHKCVLFHEYTRNGRIRQWDDDRYWWQRDEISFRRNRILLGMEAGYIDFGRFGLGKARSLQDYEKYSGLNFKRRTYAGGN